MLKDGTNVMGTVKCRRVASRPCDYFPSYSIVCETTETAPHRDHRAGGSRFGSLGSDWHVATTLTRPYARHNMVHRRIGTTARHIMVTYAER